MTGRAKITIVGAGNVGASVAQWSAAKELGDIVLVDIIEGLPEGKALDLWESGPIAGFDLKIVGSQGYEATIGSDIVIVTSGVARKPGMSREDLIDVNRKIVESVVREVVRRSPDCTLVVVTNPLDTMVYLALRVSGFAKNRVIGQAGVLDSSRFRSFVAEELGVSVEDTQALVLGGHGDEMVPLPRYCTVSGIPITQLLSCEKIETIIDRTVNAGGEIVKLLKTGSAFVSPGAAVAEMAEAIIKDKKRVIPCSAYLEGEYGLRDIYFGVPVKLGAGGVEQVIEVELTEDERRLMERSAARVRQSISSLRL
ncbi:MAG: malate dehydrogenase [Candidatus Binatia bacterium]